MAVRRRFVSTTVPEFTAQPFVDWCTEHGIAIHYIQPGKPDQNAYIERFNRTCEGRASVIRIRLGRKKSQTIYSVPESVVIRIHTRLLNSR